MAFHEKCSIRAMPTGAEAGSASGGEERGRDGHGLIAGRSGLRLGERAAHQYPGEMLAVLG